MELLRKKRSTHRTLFSKAANTLEFLISADEKDIAAIVTASDWLKAKADELFDIDAALETYVYSIEDEATMQSELEIIEKYKFKYFSLCSDSKKYIEKDKAITKEPQDQGKATSSRKYVLPKIELKQFDGEVKNWLGFWGQFHKIDEDCGLDDDDKFQYLLQATVPGSSARQLVESFPPSGANYRKAIQMLKNRFARDDLLIEMHIRELLNLVIKKNSSDGRLRTLYDRLMAQIHALDALNVTKEKYASMLYPMVESTLPEDVLRAWERFRRSSPQESTPLSGLLVFLEREVDSEERIEMAKMGFDNEKPSIDKLPTAVFTVGHKVEKVNEIRACIWCGKLSHPSSECIKPREMTLQERKDVLKAKKACYKCLKVGHNVHKCKSFVKCIVCQRAHHAILCPDLAEKSVKQETTMFAHKEDVTLLPTLLFKIKGARSAVTVRALIDTGSQRSYIKRSVAESLSLKEIDKEYFGQCLFGGVVTKQVEHKVYDITAKSLTTEDTINMKVLDSDKICGNISRIKSSHVLQQLRKLNIELSDTNDGQNMEIGLLIGSDNIPRMKPNRSISLSDDLIATETIFGWILIGKTGCTSKCSDFASVCFSSDLDVKQMWDLETIGIKDPIEIMSQQLKEQDAMDEFKNTVTVNKDNRYEVNLLWKDGRPDLESNYKLALSRLHSTTKRLLSTGNYEEYDRSLKEWLDLGIIEEVGSYDVLGGHYLPHHAVIRESSSTTRVRPVFDASAKDSKGNSINSCLDKGINLIEKIPKFMTKFREGSVGILSDIKKAFLQISLRQDDRDFLRFLWWRDTDRTELVTYRHCRVVFGITCSPFLLSATLLHHLESSTAESSSTAQILKQSFYVDNCITSLDCENDALKFRFEADQLMKSGKFELRGWVIAPSSSNTQQTVPVLGLNWDTQSDLLFCNSIQLNKDESKITKRKLLSFAHRVFDPIGFTSPVTLISKILLQRVCQQKLGWDDEVPQDIYAHCQSWLNDIVCLSRCRIERRLSMSSFYECELTVHIFCDASKDAYGACIFLRSCYKNEVTIRLLAAKARVAPIIKKKSGVSSSNSIPRLELLAILIRVRLHREFSYVLNIKDVFCWSDSSVALTWVQREANWSRFVQFRVKEIREGLNTGVYRHVPGSLNPADLLSRGCSSKVLEEQRWWDGPSWLRKSPSEWPVSNFSVDSGELVEEMSTAACQVSQSISFIYDRLNYFSKYTKIVRTVAWLFRFLHNCRFSNIRVSDKDLSADEFIKAELVLFRSIQSACDASMEKNLQVFVDSSGLKRVRTRLTYSEELEDFKSPILLPSNNNIVQKLVRFKHEESHVGTRLLISLLRENFWIVGVRRLVTRIVRDCVICKRFSTKPIQPNPAPLPDDRIKNCKAFEVTGIDMAGPLFLKSGDKCWIALFTCAVYRAVHLELCLSLSTDCFLMALRRFIARRGRPLLIYTDNGTNFVGASNRLKCLNWDRIKEFTMVKQIKWHFNVQYAPWWGGWWERLIRTLKELLRRILGKSCVNYDELETILSDCEATMNNRPLTYVTDDSGNLKPLTPSCFIQGIANSDVPDIDKIDAKSLNGRLKYLNRLREDFRSRFRSEYLGLLVQRGRGNETLKKGDIVLVEADSKRIMWPLGIVLETYEGKDGHSRVAKIKTRDGMKIRAFQRLYPLEVTDRPELRTRSGRVVRVPSRFYT